MTITHDIEHLDFQATEREVLIEVQRELAVLATAEPKFDPDKILDERMQAIRDEVIYPKPEFSVTINADGSITFDGRIIFTPPAFLAVPDYVMMHQSPTPVASHYDEILNSRSPYDCVCTPSRGLMLFS